MQTIWMNIQVGIRQVIGTGRIHFAKRQRQRRIIRILAAF